MITKKDKLIFAGCAVLIVLLVAIGIIFSPRASEDNDRSFPLQPITPVFSGRVLFVEPLQEEKNISVVPSPNVTMTKSVAGKDVQLKTNPESSFSTEIGSDGERVTFNPKTPLKPETNYVFQIFIDNQPIFSWNVRTKDIGAGQANLAGVANKIRKKLPLNKTDFGISYDGATDQFFVFIEKAPIDVTKEKANQWLRDQGLKDFGALNINYTATGSLLR